MSTLKIAVDGCELKVLRTGAGPALLIVHGGEQDADAYEAVALELRTAFDVIAYDRRGYAGSPSDQIAAGEQFIDQQVGDAAALLTRLNVGQAIVFGTSSGAVIALHLTLRFPNLVRGLILHEPALIGPFPVLAEAFRQLIAGGGRPGGGGQGRHKTANVEYWRRHEVDPFLAHQIAPAQLTPLRVPAVTALGRASAPQVQSIATWVSWRLSTALLEFPGGHEPVYETEPFEFAAAIRKACERLGID